MAIEYDGDLDFGGACNFQTTPLTTHTPEFALIGQTYKKSMARVISLGWLPAELAYWSAMFATVAAETKRQTGNNILADVADEAALLGLFKSIFATVSPFKDGISEGGQKIFDVGNERIKTILRQDEMLLGTTHLRVVGLEAVLSAMVTSTYAALETMAGDLWVAAVNKHSQLARRWVEKSNQKQIDLVVAAGYDFDMSRSMGKVLLDTKKVSFQSFSDIKGAYQTAFGDTLGSIFDDLSGVFLTEKIRHLIAHRGGNVDAKFKSDVSAFPEYANIEIGNMITLTGPKVSELLKACDAFGTKLFNAVDLWSLQNGVGAGSA